MYFICLLGLAAGSIYSYLGYPVLLALLGVFRRFHPVKRDIEPTISLIIAAYNEKGRIAAKLENSLGLDYPPEKVQIIVASDASTDGTDELAASVDRVEVSRSPLRKGKEHAQKLAINKAVHEIFVFTDAGTTLNPDALRILVRNFADERVGAVSSTDKFIGENVTGEGLYVKYEMLLRSLESRVNGLVGLSGSFFAARREVCMNWADDLQSDFNTVMNSVRGGYRVVSDPEMIGYYKDIKKGQSEFERKVRTLIRGYTVFFRSLGMLNVFAYGLFSWQLFSHKLMRWLAPFFMIACFSVSVIGAANGDRICLYALLLQAAGYFGAALAYLLPASQGFAPLKVCLFFIQVNVAILAAWWKFISGKRIQAWEPSKR